MKTTDFWVNPIDAMVIDHCGDTSIKAIPMHIPSIIDKSNKVADAIDFTTPWVHNATETHYVILDLGASHLISQMKFKVTNQTNAYYVNVYVSDSATTFTTIALAITDLPSYYQGEENPWVIFPCIPRRGRYIKIEITATTDPNYYLWWG